MKKHLPLVSVLMTAYNREHFIVDAIESVLASTYPNFELIIVDDGSKDNTVGIAKTYEARDARVQVFENEKNLGDYPNRNKAAAYAVGKYIKYLDSDDIIYPHGLQVMVDAMEKFPEAGYGISAISDSKHPYPCCVSAHDSYLEHFNGYGHFDRAPGSSIINKQAFDQVSGFSGKRMIGDNELWFKLSRYFSLVKLPRDLVWDRVHSGQESRTDYAKEYEKLRRKVLTEALSHPECPLSQLEKEEINKKLKRKAIKQKLKKWL
jgi:glycosyltransferase involved in cell wall biosynthesis